MTVIIRAVEFADGTPCPHSGQWLVWFDHDADGGQGHGVFTSEPRRAMQFLDNADALQFWNRQSLVRPLRPDGQPNKPMTALSVLIEPLL
jgi:hypothetical protein